MQKLYLSQEKNWFKNKMPITSKQHRLNLNLDNRIIVYGNWKWIRLSCDLFKDIHLKWCEANHSPPSNAKVKEYIELYLHSHNTSSWRGAQLKKAQG